MSGQSGLRVFYRHREPGLVVEALGYAKPILPGPTEADVILRVDRHGNSFSAVIHTMLCLGNQAPHLPAREGETIVECDLPEGLALTQ